jgi:sterol desaturase/sphingolipid hydroxylase (fatty acid hydroxylase superfamily)
MDYLSYSKVINAPNSFLWVGLFAFVLYGFRYIAMASMMVLIARPTFGGGWGRVHEQAPKQFNWRLNVKRELSYSLVTVLVFSALYALIVGSGLIAHSQVYFDIHQYPIWWFGLSIVVLLLLHDAFFYWSHRFMHLTSVFRMVHQVHHRSIYPTAFTAYSFHPTEAVVEAVIVAVLVFILPVHPLAFFIFQSISTAYNVYGHCGREFYPRAMGSHWLGRWVNTSTAHAMHHTRGRYNYGLYLTLWDRIMNTVDPKYK